MVAIHPTFPRHSLTPPDTGNCDFAGSSNTQIKACKPGSIASKGAMNLTKNLGMLLLAIYLILVGITMLFHITIPGIVMGILALVAGILILIGK